MPSHVPSVYQSLCQVWGDGHLSHYSGGMWDLLGLTFHASLIDGGAEPGLGDSSVSKMLALQARGPESDPQSPHQESAHPGSCL